MKNVKKIAPEGRTVLCPYLMVESIEGQMEFLVKVFAAKVTEDAKRNDGFIQHGEVLIGDTAVMMGRASQEFPAIQSMNYVYVENTDETHQKALNAGATEIMPPADRVYGIRESGFTDKFGNQWWVAQIIEKRTGLVGASEVLNTKFARTDVAGFMLRQLQTNEYLKKAVNISN